MGIVEDDILELQRAFDDAELRGDADRLRDLLADDFPAQQRAGLPARQAGWIDRHRDFRYPLIETTEVDAPLRHTAIVRCASAAERPGAARRWRSPSG
jgi:hypothetical protein